MLTGMEPVDISWLVASSASPLVAVLALWTVYVFHTYRRRWRTVDLFLLAVTSQELVTSIFTFCYAIISLIHPPFRTPCRFTQWGLVATRTFQVATLTSMVVDRALTLRWPYRYRFSVRRNQIRYHIAVLALVSVLVGVAAVFASGEDEAQCHLHPRQWDVRYAIFLLSLYGVLMLVSLVCTVQVEVHRNRHVPTKLEQCASPELHSAAGMNSPLDTHSSTGSTRALHRPSRQSSRRPYGRHAKGTSDLRWPPVALSSLVCYSLNHIPYLVLMSMATWSPFLWSPWHEAILAWLRLLEGFLVPLLLYCKDHSLRSALRRTFQRRSGALSPLVGDDGPFQMYFDKDHFRKRGTFGSVTPIGIITNYRRTPGKKRRTRTKGSGKYTLPGLHSGDSVLAKSCLSSAGFLSTEPLSKLSCADLTSLEMWREEDEENFYATLSDDFSSFSCKSADDSALSEDLRISEELYGGSFTTIANDDFEFHDTRPCGGEVKMKPALTEDTSANQTDTGYSALFARNVSFKENHQKKSDLSYNVSFSKSRDLFDFSDPPEDDDDDDVKPCPTSSTSDSSPNDDDMSPDSETAKPVAGDQVGTMSKRQKATSFSMNDLDLIHHGMDSATDVETTFALPVKSESTMSLYRLNVERDLDQLLAPSKSENNVNGDSGFGSGAQSTNPVWSGFLCRKPSDPFWNIRKPSHAAATPTKNYPGILHPRMRKIPWISAWKKLDENSERKESVAKDAKIEEEEQLSVATPLFGEDYNLNIFAKQSGVVLENEYGRIVRDDCGVKVNFYNDNVQYLEKEYDSKPSESNLFNNLDVTRGEYNFNKKSQNVDDIFCNNTDNSDLFKCEPRLQGGHYENMFSTKENIFAQYDLYRDRSTRKSSSGRKLTRRESDRVVRNNITDIVSPYSRISNVGRQGSFSSGSRAVDFKFENRRGLKRRDSKHLDGSEKCDCESNVPEFQDRLLMTDDCKYDALRRRSSGDQYDYRSNFKLRNRDIYEPRSGVARHESQNRKSGSFKDEQKRIKVNRSDSQSARERKFNLDCNGKQNGIYLPKNEGLWVNAEPFYLQNPTAEPEAPDNYTFANRKSDLTRKESKTRSEKPASHVRRKTSATRSKKFQPEAPDGASQNDLGAPKRRENDEPKLDDFFKHREKCEDNFSHIQNLNRQTSAERELTRMDNLIYGGRGARKGEIYPFDTFQEQHYPSYISRTVFDINENCKQKKLAITDFL